MLAKRSGGGGGAGGGRTSGCRATTQLELNGCFAVALRTQVSFSGPQPCHTPIVQFVEGGAPDGRASLCARQASQHADSFAMPPTVATVTSW